MTYPGGEDSAAKVDCSACGKSVSPIHANDPKSFCESGRFASAAPSYDYQRILDLVDRIEACVGTVRDALSPRTLSENLTARNYTAQIRTDASELETLLLDRHLSIQREG